MCCDGVTEAVNVSDPTVYDNQSVGTPDYPDGSVKDEDEDNAGVTYHLLLCISGWFG